MAAAAVKWPSHVYYQKAFQVLFCFVLGFLKRSLVFFLLQRLCRLKCTWDVLIGSVRIWGCQASSVPRPKAAQGAVPGGLHSLTGDPGLSQDTLPSEATSKGTWAYTVSGDRPHQVCCTFRSGQHGLGQPRVSGTASCPFTHAE